MVGGRLPLCRSKGKSRPTEWAKKKASSNRSQEKRGKNGAGGHQTLPRREEKNLKSYQEERKGVGKEPLPYTAEGVRKRRPQKGKKAWHRCCSWNDSRGKWVLKKKGIMSKYIRRERQGAEGEKKNNFCLDSLCWEILKKINRGVEPIPSLERGMISL